MRITLVRKSQLVTKVLLAVGTLAFAFDSSLAQQEPRPRASPEWNVGKRNAPVVIEVFSDYECRRCAIFNPELKRVQKKYGERVRIVFREFPLTQIHGKALLAAQAAEAAGLQGKYFEMNDALFSRASEWKESRNPEEQFVSYARDLKLNLKRFRADVTGPQVQERIRLDVERARFLNLPGTPTVVINGGVTLHEDLANLDSEIDAKLKALGVRTGSGSDRIKKQPHIFEIRSAQ
jgi:protein-disulfide isomerase